MITTRRPGCPAYALIAAGPFRLERVMKLTYIWFAYAPKGCKAGSMDQRSKTPGPRLLNSGHEVAQSMEWADSAETMPARCRDVAHGCCSDLRPLRAAAVVGSLVCPIRKLRVKHGIVIAMNRDDRSRPCEPRDW